MRIYCYYTAVYQDLYDQWFGPSAALEYEVVVRRDADTKPVDYKDLGWISICRRKVDFIIEAVKDSWNQPFVFSDPDVQFLGPTSAQLSRLIRGKDLLFQREMPGPLWMCAGFFVCRGNARTLRFWQEVGAQMDETDDRDDQDCARRILMDESIAKIQRRLHDPRRSHLIAARLSQHRFNPFRLRWEYLPVAFFGGGTLTGEQWHPGKVLPVPDSASMHHANFTVGLANKMAQLRYVRDVVDRRSQPSSGGSTSGS